METPLSGNPKTGRKPLLIPYHVTMQRRMMNCPAVRGDTQQSEIVQRICCHLGQLVLVSFRKGEEER